MPKRETAIHGETKRLSLYAGNTVSDQIVNQLGMRYAIESPTIARMTLTQSTPRKSKRLATANVGQRYTRARLMAVLVRKLASRDALRVEAAKFYLKHIEFFTDAPDDKRADVRKLKLGLNVDPETYALCQSLPYSIVGRGSVSLMYRVIVHFFAVKEKIIPAPPVSKHSGPVELPDPTIRAYEPRRPLPDRINGKDVGAPTALSFDPEGGKELKHLGAIFKRKNVGVIRALIKSVAADADQLEGVKKFYRHEFVNKEPAPGRVLIRLNLTKEERSLLDHLSYSIMGDFNRSLTARCIVGYFNKSGERRLSS